MDWARILAYVTGSVDQELLARAEYLAAENRILKAQLKGRLKLSDAERATLAELGRRLGRKALAEVATVARPDTILAWYRKLVARKFDGSKARRSPGRPRIKREIEQLIVRMAKENHDWGYDRIVGALANLGYQVCDQTVGNVLQRHGLPPVPERKRTTTWSAFIRIHLALLAGTDFFTVEVLSLRGLVTYYVLFFIHLESRRVNIAGITIHPDERWMQQIARNVTMEGCGALRDRIRAGAGLLGSGHHLILDVDRLEAVLGDAKRHRPTVVIASPDRERTSGADLLQQAGADELIDNLSGGFALDIRRQFNSAIIAPRSRGQNDELRVGKF
jgi:hypothetical protein